MTQREIQENLIRTVRDMLLTSCEKMGAQSIEHCWTRHDGTEVKLTLTIHPAGEKEEKPEDELRTYARVAVEKFGMNKQVDMAIEEMSELTKALLKYRRAADCATTVKSGDNIREEMEDVRIMLAQLDCIYGRSPQWAEKKLAHLKELVKGEECDGDV
nr:MAG TPA: nucleoside triphosphate pyrophosphohydrolase [Caudoviricetes sp.]